MKYDVFVKYHVPLETTVTIDIDPELDNDFEIDQKIKEAIVLGPSQGGDPDDITIDDRIVGV